jgi:ABC-2 type transport system permease protein
MTRLVRAELRAMRQTRSVVLVSALAVAVAALAAATASAHQLTDLLRTEIVVLTLLVLIAGAIAGASEFQYRTISWTLLATPDRRAAAAAKVVATAVLGAVIAAAVLGATLAVGVLKEGTVPLGTGAGELVAGQLVLGALTAVFGLTVGVALRNMPAAIASVFTLALVIPLVFEAKPSLEEEARFLPYGELSAAALSLGSAPADSGPQLGWVASGVVLLAWTALVGAAAFVRFRADV